MLKNCPKKIFFCPQTEVIELVKETADRLVELHHAATVVLIEKWSKSRILQCLCMFCSKRYTKIEICYVLSWSVLYRRTGETEENMSTSLKKKVKDLVHCDFDLGKSHNSSTGLMQMMMQSVKRPRNEIRKNFLTNQLAVYSTIQ